MTKDEKQLKRRLESKDYDDGYTDAYDDAYTHGYNKAKEDSESMIKEGVN